MDTICGFKAELPVGLRTEEGSREKSFILKKTGEVTETILTNDAYRRNHPQQWMGRLIASYIESIGDLPVYEKFRAGKFKKLPEGILQLPIADASYLLCLGHMNTYGNTLDAGTQECVHCGRKTPYEIDLQDMKLENEGEVAEEISIQLDTGFYKKMPKDDPHGELPYKGIYWNRYYFRPPVINDAVLHEKYWTRNNLVNFNMRVLWSCLLRVERWEKLEEEEFVKTDEMPDNFRNMEGLDLLDKLDGQDRKLIRQEINKIPQLNMQVTQECNACGEDIEISVDSTNFFPLA